MPKRRSLGRPRKHPIVIQLAADQPVLIRCSLERLRKNAASTIITDIFVFIQETLFTDSRRKKINGLLNKGVFTVVGKESVPKGTRIFNSRFVDEIKYSRTD